MDIPFAQRAPKMEGQVEERLKRGREQRDRNSGLRNLCLEFARGNQYLWLGSDGKLYDAQRNSVRADPGYPNRHRVHQTRNLILPIVNAKVSASTQRVPSYEILHSTLDPEDIAGARVAERIMLAGYDQWRLRRQTQKAVYLAIVADESFAMPYWDSSIGPYVETEDGHVGMGDVRVRILSGNQVMWEQGIEYEESSWCAIEYAKPIDDIKRDPDFLGGKLVPDADANRITSDKKRSSQNLALVTEYFERPCPDYPEGRRKTYGNGREIYPEEPYPLRDNGGEAIDEPCLHRLSYIIDPDGDSDLGLVRHLIDAQRTYNDSENKQIELKNLALLPQLLAPEGSILTKPSDAPGAITYYRTLPGMPPPEWREAPSPQFLAQLGTIADRAKADMGFISDSNEIPSQVESGKGIVALAEKDAMAWQRFIGDLAEWHSRVARDCLTLVQRHYTEERTLRYRGRMGWQTISDFRGADLHKQTDVRVLPGSLEPQTQEAINAKVMMFAEAGWISPETAMSAINGGQAQSLIDTYEKDVARANLILQKIERGPEFLFSEPPRPVFPQEDPGPALDEMGQPIMTGELDEMGQPAYQPAITVPGWMPRPFDNARIQKAVFSDFMKTPAYDAWGDDQKKAANAYYGALLDLEAKEAAREAAMQQQMAMDLGMANASKPGSKEMPDMPQEQ